MTDNRFKDFPLDARFPSLNVDFRFATLGVDARFLEGIDTRFEGDAYGTITPGIRIDAPAFLTGPTITGTPDNGSVMTVAYTFTGTEPITEERRWKINTGIVSGQTGFTWTGLGLVSGDVVTCEVRLTGPEENTGWIASNPLTVVEPPIIVPTNATLPVINGAATENDTLDTTTGTWNGTAPFTYTYQWRRNGTAISGATASFYRLVTADVGASITVAVTATNPTGSNTAVSLPIGPVAAGGALTLRQQIEGLEDQSTPNGRQSTNPLKVIGVDALPSGVTRSGNIITMSGAGAALVDWDLTNHQVNISGTNNRIENCLWGPTENFAANYFVEIRATSVGAVVRYNTMDGFDGFGGPGTFINAPPAGTGASATGAQGWTVEYNRFLTPNGDVFKIAGNGVCRWNYFGPLTNYPVGTAAWSAGTTYTAGQYALNSTPRLYRSRVSGNINNPIPSGLTNGVAGGSALTSVNYSDRTSYAVGALVNTTTDYAVYRSLIASNLGRPLTDTAAWALEPGATVVWLTLDPHGDAITVTASDGPGVDIERNLFNWSATSITRAVGTTQCVRIVRNTGTDVFVGPVDFSENLLTAPYDGFYAVATGFIRNWFSTVTYTLGGFARVGSTYYRSLQASNRNNPPETSPAFWEVTTDINAPGPIRYLNNWLPRGQNNLYFADMSDAVDAWEGNRDTITGAMVPGPVLRTPPTPIIPTLTAGPTVTGSPTNGQILTVAFAFAGSEPITQEIRWTLNGTPVSGAVASTWLVAGAVTGNILGAEVRLTNTQGTTGWVASNALTAFEPSGWNITAGDGSATVASFPTFIGEWSITTGDTTATINSFPEV